MALSAAGVVVFGNQELAHGLSINPRASWAIDRPPKGPLPSEDVRFLLVHHSASRNGHTGADTPGILRSFYDFHTGPEKGWNDIAYNFLIDNDGGIWEGRAGSLDGPVSGDATGGNQGFSQLVCLIGDFNSANPTAAARNSLAALLASLANRYLVDTEPGATVSFTSRGSNRWPAGSAVTTPTITGHRTMSRTTCPGDNLYSYVAGSLVADVNGRRGGTVTTGAPTTSPPTSADGVSGQPPPVASVSTPPSSTAPEAYTTTSGDPVPTVAASPAVATAVPSVAPSTSVPTSQTLALQPLEASPQPVATQGLAQSPLLWGGLGVAGLASALLVWRNRRMGE